ncbi:hypothetical protein OHA70_03445 [Kribbella sp. NBC_00382]|uniref:hypothetical protein n=1 Tax=Kribbella sp. NBC_00382 TaxID=2975967 RepID=UPI002E24977A
MNDRLGDLLAELAKQHSPATEEELARARAEWPDLPASAITHRRHLRRSGRGSAGRLFDRER